jgi:hypothetical protein
VENTHINVVKGEQKQMENSELKRPEDTPMYRVMVDDNFHFMDESERTTAGDFDTLEAALSADARSSRTASTIFISRA